MRKLLNHVLRPVGYEFRRSDFFADGVAVLQSRPEGLKFVQIGAHDGVQFDDLYATATQQRCAGLAVEPLPDVFEGLSQNYADYPRIVAVNVAVHATAESVELYRVMPGALDTLPPWARGLASFDRAHLVKHGIPDHAIASAR